MFNPNHPLSVVGGQGCLEFVESADAYEQGCIGSVVRAEYVAFRKCNKISIADPDRFRIGFDTESDSPSRMRASTAADGSTFLNVILIGMVMANSGFVSGPPPHQTIRR